MSVKNLTLFFIFLFLSSCSSPRYFFNYEACNNSEKYYHPLGLFYGTMGLIFQQGECAQIRPLKIEQGGIYVTMKDSVLASLDSLNESGLNEFSSAIGCHYSSRDLFNSEIKKNKEQIFGKSYERSPRQVMLSVYAMIDSNKELSELCWK